MLSILSILGVSAITCAVLWFEFVRIARKREQLLHHLGTDVRSTVRSQTLLLAFYISWTLVLSMIIFIAYIQVS